MIQCPFKYASGGIPPSHSGKLDDPKHYCRRHRTAVNKRLLKKGKSADSNDRIWIPHSERIKKQKVSQEKKKKERVQPTLTREEFDALPESLKKTFVQTYPELFQNDPILHQVTNMMKDVQIK